MLFQPGDEIQGKYRVQRLLGKGGQAEVYLVTHLSLGVDRAIKVIAKEMVGVGSQVFADFRRRFEQEAKLGAGLTDSRLVHVYDLLESAELAILEMEYVPGGSLAELITASKRQGQNLPLERCLAIGADMAAALASLHAMDIVHRDLKPANVLLDSQGRAKVGDLGLAQSPWGDSRRSLLGEGAPHHPGTPAYMSPEQRSSTEHLQPSSDVYAWAMLLFELLTLRQWRNQPSATRVSALRKDVPSWLDDLLARCLAENSRERPWDGAALVVALRSGGYRRWPAVAALFAVLVVGVLALRTIDWPPFLPPDVTPQGPTPEIAVDSGGDPDGGLPWTLGTALPVEIKIDGKGQVEVSGDTELVKHLGEFNIDQHEYSKTGAIILVLDDHNIGTSMRYEVAASGENYYTTISGPEATLVDGDQVIIDVRRMTGHTIRFVDKESTNIDEGPRTNRSQLFSKDIVCDKCMCAVSWCQRNPDDNCDISVVCKEAGCSDQAVLAMERLGVGVGEFQPYSLLDVASAYSFWCGESDSTEGEVLVLNGPQTGGVLRLSEVLYLNRSQWLAEAERRYGVSDDDGFSGGLGLSLSAVELHANGAMTIVASKYINECPKCNPLGWLSVAFDFSPAGEFVSLAVR